MCCTLQVTVFESLSVSEETYFVCVELQLSWASFDIRWKDQHPQNCNCQERNCQLPVAVKEAGATVPFIKWNQTCFFIQGHHLVRGSFPSTPHCRPLVISSQKHLFFLTYSAVLHTAWLLLTVDMKYTVLGEWPPMALAFVDKTQHPGWIINLISSWWKCWKFHVLSWTL